jgi:CHRD domain-containing protein
MKMLLARAFALSAAMIAAPAQAKVMKFHATLDSKSIYTTTGSEATGTARIRIDTDRRLVSVDMVVDGITIFQLWSKLMKAPIGPIHFHKVATAGAGSGVALVFPLPFGPIYHPTPRGIHVKMDKYDYAAGAKLLNSTLSFDDFVAAMKSGLMILNIHTEKFNLGEISGMVAED